MSAPACICCVLGIYDIVFVNKCETVKVQQGFDQTDGMTQFVLRFDSLVFDQHDRFFHLLEVAVDQVRYRLGPAVRHCLQIERADI